MKKHPFRSGTGAFMLLLGTRMRSTVLGEPVLVGLEEIVA